MTDLTDRMRTCAAYLVAKAIDDLPNEVIEDAAGLLIEASNALEQGNELLREADAGLKQAADMLRAPMPPPPGFAIDRTPSPAWTMPLLPQGLSELAGQHRISTCPRCKSCATKRVRRQGNKLMLSCPVCSETWEYKPPGEWR